MNLNPRIIPLGFVKLAPQGNTALSTQVDLIILYTINLLSSLRCKTGGGECQIATRWQRRILRQSHSGYSPYRQKCRRRARCISGPNPIRIEEFIDG